MPARSVARHASGHRRRAVQSVPASDPVRVCTVDEARERSSMPARSVARRCSYAMACDRWPTGRGTPPRSSGFSPGSRRSAGSSSSPNRGRRRWGCRRGRRCAWPPILADRALVAAEPGRTIRRHDRDDASSGGIRAGSVGRGDRRRCVPWLAASSGTTSASAPAVEPGWVFPLIALARVDRVRLAVEPAPERLVR